SLMDLRSVGNEAAIVILVFRNDAEVFIPNARMDPAFATAVTEALRSGVQLYPLLLDYREGVIWYDRVLPFRLD
ncbi:MAG: DNA/RNA nuclease SfsA, partial [Spirochaetota bacterium]